jgi:hypothetical protein
MSASEAGEYGMHSVIGRDHSSSPERRTIHTG